MKFVTTLFFLLLINVSVRAQEHRNLKGKIVDAKDSTPVAYCNIYLAGQYYGTHSNEGGNFELNYKAQEQDTLIISSVGYKTIKIALSKSFSIDSLFFLDRAQHVLDEVTITAKRDSASFLVGKAISMISRNFPTKKFYQEAFFRELVLRDSTYVRLIEAAIEIQDPGYDAQPEKIRVRVKEIRKSDDFLEYDAYTKVHEKLYGDRNNLYECLKSDFVRRSVFDGFKFLSENFVNTFSFEIREFFFEENDKFCVINYESLHKGALQEYGSITINMRNFAIVKMEYTNGLISSVSDEIRHSFFYDGHVYKKFVVSFREIEGKYFLDYINCFTPVSKAWVTDNSQGGESLQYFQCSLFVTNVITKNKEMEKIRIKDSESREVDLYGKDWTYNQSFWKDYNFVVINPDLKKAVKDLEKQKQLEKQFNKQ